MQIQNASVKTKEIPSREGAWEFWFYKDKSNKERSPHEGRWIL